MSKVVYTKRVQMTVVVWKGDPRIVCETQEQLAAFFKANHEHALEFETVTVPVLLTCEEEV